MTTATNFTHEGYLVETLYPNGDDPLASAIFTMLCEGSSALLVYRQGSRWRAMLTTSTSDPWRIRGEVATNRGHALQSVLGQLQRELAVDIDNHRDAIAEIEQRLRKADDIVRRSMGYEPVGKAG